MTAEQFTYWLQGFVELNGGPPSLEQWQSIRDHLALVFNKVTPNRQRAQTSNLYLQRDLADSQYDALRCSTR